MGNWSPTHPDSTTWWCLKGQAGSWSSIPYLKEAGSTPVPPQDRVSGVQERAEPPYPTPAMRLSEVVGSGAGQCSASPVLTTTAEQGVQRPPTVLTKEEWGGDRCGWLPPVLLPSPTPRKQDLSMEKSASTTSCNNKAVGVSPAHPPSRRQQGTELTPQSKALRWWSWPLPATRIR